MNDLKVLNENEIDQVAGGFLFGMLGDLFGTSGSQSGGLLDGVFNVLQNLPIVGGLFGLVNSIFGGLFGGGSSSNPR